MLEPQLKRKLELNPQLARPKSHLQEVPAEVVNY